MSDNRRLFEIKSIERTCTEKFNPLEGSHKYGYIDSNGKCVISPIYDNAYDFVNGVAIVGMCGNNGYRSWYIYPDGRSLYSNSYNYQDLNDFSGEYAVVDKDGLNHKCHINKHGEPLYPQTYSVLYNFNKAGKAIGVRNINRNDCVYVVIDTAGNELYSCRGIYNSSTYMKKLEPYLK